jgi:nondiscriminating glutamyl-tRNA synthetase
VGVADVVFDPGKLRWLSARHIEKMSLEELAEAVIPFIDRERYPISDESIPVILEAVRSHLAVFGEINEQLDPFIPNFDEARAAAREALLEDARAGEIVSTAARNLQALDGWGEGAIDTALREAGKEVGASGRALFEPLRIALTGQSHGPPLRAVIIVLGRAETLRLLNEIDTDHDPG